MLDIGFSGTRKGMTRVQKVVLTKHLMHYVYGSDPRDLQGADEIHFHHGCCDGADHEMAILMDFLSVCVHAYPPKVRSLMSMLAYQRAHVRHPRKPYLERNDDIVKVADLMLIAPGDDAEVFAGRGGTYYSWRKAIELEVPWIAVYPNGGSIKSLDFGSTFRIKG